VPASSLGGPADDRLSLPWAFLAGTLILTETILGTFDDLFAEADAGTDAFVRGTSPLDLGHGEGHPPIEAALADTIASVEGVGGVAVRVNGYAQILDRSGKVVGNPGGGLGTNCR
jgi:putative ABC transport system permease protein